MYHYYYVCVQFGHRTAHSPWPGWAGAMHGDELFYLFGDPLRRRPTAATRYTQEERALADTVMTYWTNFARTG